MRKKLPILLFNLLYLIPFTVYYISARNYEFLWYIGVTIFFLVLILATLSRTGFDDLLLWGLSLWGFLHMAGGGIRIGGTVLYGLTLIPFIEDGEMTILKFDQLVHFFGFGVATLAGFQLLRPMLTGVQRRGVLYFLLICIGMGLGALNEMVEFAAVLTFPETGVGGYINTCLDLVSNALGAAAAVLLIRGRYLSKPLHRESEA